jgi:hypothetical protein
MPQSTTIHVIVGDVATSDGIAREHFAEAGTPPFWHARLEVEEDVTPSS